MENPSLTSPPHLPGPEKWSNAACKLISRQQVGSTALSSADRAQALMTRVPAQQYFWHYGSPSSRSIWGRRDRWSLLHCAVNKKLRRRQFLRFCQTAGCGWALKEGHWPVRENSPYSGEVRRWLNNPLHCTPVLSLSALQFAFWEHRYFFSQNIWDRWHHLPECQKRRALFITTSGYLRRDFPDVSKCLETDIFRKGDEGIIHCCGRAQKCIFCHIIAVQNHLSHSIVSVGSQFYSSDSRKKRGPLEQEVQRCSWHWPTSYITLLLFYRV